jgi:AcrR family transcriptional regulator
MAAMRSGLRERKKLATRRALHEAALRLVAERGLDSVSVEDIAARADVSPRTFFNYFSSKDDAVVGFDPGAPESQADAFRSRPAGESPVEALRAVVRAQAEEMAGEPELWPLRLKVVETHPVLTGRLAAGFGASERALAAAIAERTGTRLDADVYPMLLAAAGAAAMRTAMHLWLATGFTASFPGLVDQAWDVLVAGLPAPPD